MRPNVLFILVDGLRADQCFGIDKTSYTPLLDSLISSGVYFKNTFSSADGTMISLNCILNSKSQFQTGIRAQKIILYVIFQKLLQNLALIPKFQLKEVWLMKYHGIKNKFRGKLMSIGIGS